MTDLIRITEADLRGFMRDSRYWQYGHPEREGFNDWVTRGWQSLLPRDAPARESVWVRAHVRKGRKVTAHWRGAPPGSDAKNDAGTAVPGNDLTPANWWRLPFLRGPSGRGGGGARRPPSRAPDRRRLGPDGRDRVDDIRSDPGTVYEGRVKGGGEQWFRPGGQAGRQSDLESLSPLGPPRPDPRNPAVSRVELPEGRYAMIRDSTRNPGLRTMDIYESVPGTGENRLIAKIRYP